MVGVSTWLRYISAKYDYTLSVTRKAYRQQKLNDDEVFETMWKACNERLTFLHWNKGEEMDPIIGTKGGTLLVRKIPQPDPTTLEVGDVVVHKDPTNLANLLVRRIAALQDWEMASTDENDVPFTLVKNQCWVLADNEKLNPKEAHDSRIFGPLYMPYIVGRAIYCLRSAVDHGPVKNSRISTRKDSAVLEVELDVDEMAENHKA